MRRVLSGRRILVVEDEYFLADDLATTLRLHGADICGPVGTIEEARARLADSGPIDAAVLDLQLRDDRSFGIADVLEERAIPFIVATGYGRSVTPERHREVVHFEKPYDPDDLVKTLAKMVARGNSVEVNQRPRE